MLERKKTRQVMVGDVPIGGDAPIAVQSMTITDTRDIEKTIFQIAELVVAGCEIVRVAVPDMAAAEALGEIKKQVNVPLVADIHFNHIFALKCASFGIDKIRINPGNIGKKERIKAVVDACKERNIPIRIGVNGGSLRKDLIAKHGGVTAEAMVESALEEVGFLEENGFNDIILSLKSSDVPMMIEAYRQIAERTDYPLHLGVTEAGMMPTGAVKSAVGIGSLLLDGIGDTIRVSLTADPVEEVEVAYDLLQALHLRERGVNIIACPSCGRCDIDLFGVTAEVKERLKDIRTPMNIAVMGCEVNGPGEARTADLGIAGGGGVGLLIDRGEIVKKVKESEMVDVLVEAVEKRVAEIEEQNTECRS